MRAGMALNTQRAYASGWKAFRTWCEAVGLTELPASPRTVQDFVTWCVLQRLRMETLHVRMNAIAHFHREAGQQSPIDTSVRDYLSYARRERREEPRGRAALLYDHLRRIASDFSDSPFDVRNRAMILLGFASGWRRSEIVSLRLCDVNFVPKGLELWLRSSKTDQAALGRLVGIEAGKKALTCPVRALRAWLKVRGSWDGPLFVRLTPYHRVTRVGLSLRGDVVHVAVKQALDSIGEDPKRFGAHSLRAGMITEAAKHGASEAAIRQRTGHRCSQSIQRYIRPATAFEFNPLKGVL